ncbi:MAG: hypothetical protein ABH862_05030 [Candidatus Omnitrophota bacterium]
MRYSICLLSIIVALNGCAFSKPFDETLKVGGAVVDLGSTVVKTAGNIVTTGGKLAGQTVQTAGQAVHTAATTPILREAAVKQLAL